MHFRDAEDFHDIIVALEQLGVFLSGRMTDLGRYRSERSCPLIGVDLRTVQTWLGHSDMESTMRYLKPARSQAVRVFRDVDGCLPVRDTGHADGNLSQAPAVKLDGQTMP